MAHHFTPEELAELTGDTAAILPFPQRRALPKLELITTPIAEPESEDFYCNATPEQWDARMREKYGADYDGGEAA